MLFFYIMDTPAAVPEESTAVENENGIDAENIDNDSVDEEAAEDNTIEEIPIEEENAEEEIAISEEEMAELEDDYIALMEYIQQNDIPADISFEDYTASYTDDGYDTPEEYGEAYYDMLVSEDNVASSSSGSTKWYYNTGTALPQSASYSTYNLLSVVQKGDIVYEANGGFGVTGHIAIVEGRYYSASNKQFYLRIIEAILPEYPGRTVRAGAGSYLCRLAPRRAARGAARIVLLSLVAALLAPRAQFDLFGYRYLVQFAIAILGQKIFIRSCKES